MKAILDSPQLGAFIISFIITTAFVAVLFFAMFHGINDNQTLQLLTGALIQAFGMVVSYWIGSSSSSKNKDAIIAQQISNSTTGGVK
jgi:hypothetical protein